MSDKKKRTIEVDLPEGTDERELRSTILHHVPRAKIRSTQAPTAPSPSGERVEEDIIESSLLED